jgi:hypothetical protein
MGALACYGIGLIASDLVKELNDIQADKTRIELEIAELEQLADHAAASF